MKEFINRFRAIATDKNRINCIDSTNLYDWCLGKEVEKIEIENKKLKKENKQLEHERNELKNKVRELTSFFYTPESLAKIFSVSTKTILRKIKKGEIKAFKFGKLWRIQSTDVLELILKMK